MNKILAILGALISVLYIVNPTAGIIELIPDNLPFIGNLDEAAATVLLLKCLGIIRGKKGDEMRDVTKKE